MPLCLGFILFEDGGLCTLEWCPQQCKWQEDVEQPQIQSHSEYSGLEHPSKHIPQGQQGPSKLPCARCGSLCSSLASASQPSSLALCSFSPANTSALASQDCPVSSLGQG